jgi:hypothetical protein
MRIARNTLYGIIASALLANVNLTLAAETPPVDEIVEMGLRANYYQGMDGRARVAMTIIDQQGRERSRDLTIIRKDAVDGEDPEDKFIGDQKFYVYFQRPADVRKMAFMVWKHVDSDDDRWLYLPALDLVKRIASSEERSSFAGSHFFYEDVSGRNKDEDSHELLESSENYYVLKSTPKEPDVVEFDYYKMWIHRGSGLVTKTEYYDEKDRKYREYEVLAVETIDGHPTVIKSKMSDERIGGHTILEYSGVAYDLGLPDDIFTERYLRRAPIQYLRN